MAEDKKMEKQLNVHLPKQFVERLEPFRKEHGWSRREMVVQALNTLRVLMSLHEEIAEAVEPDIGELYRRLARKVPSYLVEPKGDMALGWTNEKREDAAIQIEGWFITADAETGELIAVNESGQRGGIADGAISDLPVPSRDEAVLVPLSQD
jgi:hypothetical protein